MRRIRWLGALLAFVLLPGNAAAQERGSVSGVVIGSQSQQPLPGVEVAIPAVGSSAVTDDRGRFLLSNVPMGPQTLRVSLLGYRQVTREVTVSATTASVTIQLETDPLQLDQLVVVGYGTQRRGDIAGAVASLRPETVEDISVTSVNQVLQGRLAGVQVVQNSGTPGAAMTVRVRGASSISGGNEPLYVIDGVPLNQGDFSSLTVGFGGQDIDAISDLSPSEIESIEVLKDASAAAIYGSRASNGVILITTKRGASMRPEINFSGYYGQQKEWRRVQFLNAEQYLEVYNEGYTNRWGPASDWGYDAYWGVETPGMVFETEFPAGDIDTNWLNEVLQTAPISNFEGSVRGGTDQVRYFVSGGSLIQDGIIKAMGYRRLNGRVNLDYNPFDRLSVGTNVSLTRSVTVRARSDNTIYSAWSNALANPPVEPVYTPDGDYYSTWYLNPVGMNNEAEAEERGIRILGNMFATYNLFDWLNVRASVGLDQFTLRSRSYDSPTFGPWASSGGAAQSAHSYINKLVYEGTLNWNRELLGNQLSGVFGTSFEDNAEDYSFVQGQQFPTEYFKYLTSAATIADGSSSRTDYGLVSFFGRASYNFQDRVVATVNFRRDGSSRFGPDTRYGTFPSASVIWRIGNESFMESQNIVSNLALRASYGITGNQQALGNFAARGLFGGGENYLDHPGIAPSQLANPDLRWEKTAQLNIGADFSVLDDRLALTFDYYNKLTEDLLVQLPVPRTTGFTSIWSNIGSLENKGIELAVNAHLIQPRSADGLSWSTILSFARNRNKVTELYNDQPFGSGFANRVEEGKPLGFFYGYLTDGLFQDTLEVAAHATQDSETAPGDIRFRDLNNDGVINSDDQTMIGNPWPDFEGGITNTASFRGFDLSAFVQFSVGNEIFNANGIYMDQFGSGGDNHTIKALDRWTPTNTDTDQPRAVGGDPNFNTRDSDRFMEDGSYWRLKNVVLGYTLPASLAERIGYRSARIYVQGQNVLTFTDYTGFDPEVNYNGNSAVTRGTDFYTLPQARVWSFGFNLGF